MAPGMALDTKRPKCSDQVEELMRRKHLEAHKRNIARTKSTICNQWSVREELKLAPARRNAKKELVAEERYSSIEKENRRLLGRMQEIERKGSQKAAAHLVLGSGPSMQRSASVPAAGSRASTRNKELRRIDAENQRLLKRLQGAKSSVDLAAKEQSYQVQQGYMKMRCEHQKEDWILERVQNEALLAAHLKERAAARAPPPEPAPISIEPAGPSDAECIRLLHLQDKLRARAEDAEEGGEELPEGEHLQEGGDESEEAVAARALEEAEGADGEPSATPKKERTALSYAGLIPEASEKLVDKLMAEYAEQQAKDEEDSLAAADDAKAAAAAAFREAEALDVASEDVFLSYERVVQQRRQREREAIGLHHRFTDDMNP